MTKLEWSSLCVGDFLVERRTGVCRRVLLLSRTPSGRVYVTLLKLTRHAWTPGPFTSYVSSDDTRGERWSLHHHASATAPAGAPLPGRGAGTRVQPAAAGAAPAGCQGRRAPAAAAGGRS